MKRRLPPMPSLSQLMSIFQITARKNLSQNFLLNQELCDRIVDIGFKNHRIKGVMEVGCGPGGLTRSLLENEKIEKVVGVELDDRMMALLQGLSSARPDNFFIAHGDILKVDEREMMEYFLDIDDYRVDWEDESKFGFIGNLPFGIATPLIFKWLRLIGDKSGPFEVAGRIPLVLMFQHEVALRIAAEYNNKLYSRISVVSQNYCECNYVMKVQPGSFIPKPKVAGAIVRMVPRVVPIVPMPVVDLEMMCKVFFRYRRKNMYNNMKSFLSRHEILEVFEKAGEEFAIGRDITLREKRAEQLTVEELARLGKISVELFGDKIRNGQKESNLSKAKRKTDENMIDELLNRTALSTV